MLTNGRIVLVGMALVMMTTVSLYLITAYTPTFGSEVLKLSQVDVFLVTLCVGISNFAWLPVMGALSDRIGRRPLLLTCTVLALLTAIEPYKQANRLDPSPALVWSFTNYAECL
jgi:MFS family permease